MTLPPGPTEPSEPPALPDQEAKPSPVSRSPYWRPPGSPTGAGRFVTVCLAAFVGVLAVQLATSASVLINFEEWTDFSTTQVPFLVGWIAGIAIALAGIGVLTGVAWMVWQHTAHANRSTLVPTAFKPASVWWWIVPFASLFMPFLAIGDLMKSGVDRPILRRAWWTSYLLFGFTTAASNAWSPSALAGVGREVVALVSYLLGIVAAVLAISVVRSVTTEMEALRQEQGWPVGRAQIQGRTQFVLAVGAAAATSAAAFAMGIALPALIDAAALTEGESFATETFKVGTCFNDSDEQFPQVSCDEPHEAEAFAVLEHPDQQAYPGQDALESWAEPICYGRFERYTGIPYEDSQLDFGYLFPTGQGWAAGDREVICYLFDPSGNTLDEPIETGTGTA